MIYRKNRQYQLILLFLRRRNRIPFQSCNVFSRVLPCDSCSNVTAFIMLSEEWLVKFSVRIALRFFSISKILEWKFCNIEIQLRILSEKQRYEKLTFIVCVIISEFKCHNQDGTKANIDRFSRRLLMNLWQILLFGFIDISSLFWHLLILAP